MVGVLVRGHCVVFRNGGDAGADESGHAAGGAARLLRTPPAQTPQVQERHFPQLPRLQTRETRLGLLRTSGLCDADERVRAREETELEEKEDRGQCSINTPPSSSSVSVYKQLSQ